MERVAVILTRDQSGLGKLGRTLVDQFGYRLKSNREAKETFDAAGVPCSLLADGEAEVVLSQDESPELLIANYLDVVSVGREFMSWKSAWAAFDHEIVSCIRLAARHPGKIGVFGDPSRYGELLDELEKGEGMLSAKRKVELAAKALGATAEFDAALASFLETQATDAPDIDALSGYPKTYRLVLPRTRSLEEGANRFQKAALYGGFLEHFEQVGGPELDFLSIAGVSFGAFLIGEFEKPAAAVIRNEGIVAAGCDSDSEKLWSKFDFNAIAEDSSGTVLVTNQSIDANIAESIGRRCSSVLAPRFSEKAIEVIDRGVRLLIGKEGVGYESLYEHRDVVGGMLIQDRDRASVNPFEWQADGPVQPLVDQWEDFLFAVRLCRHVRSSAIVAVRNERLVSVSAGASSPFKAMRFLDLDTSDLANCVVAMDESIADPRIIEQSMEKGIAGIAHPGLIESASSDEIRSAIVDSGLVVMATGREQLKI